MARVQPYCQPHNENFIVYTSAVDHFHFTQVLILAIKIMQLSKYQIRGVIRFLCVKLEKADENCNCNFLYFGLVNSDNLRFIVEMTTNIGTQIYYS